MIDFAQFEAFHFLRPAWLLLLAPIVITVVYPRSFTQPASHWNTIIAQHLLPSITIQGDEKHWFTPLHTGLVLLALCALVMSGPTWQRQTTPFVEDKAVLLIALDLSETMSQTDIQPSRLERAKQKISDLIALRGNARTGLIAYSGSAHQVLPLSNDPEIIRQFLAALDSSMMPTLGKFPEKIIPLVKQGLVDANVPSTLLIIGDGVGPESVMQFEAFFENARNNVSPQLIVLGVGLTELDGDSVTDMQFGGAHLALQQNALENLANTSSGKYLPVASDKSDVQQINRWVDQHLSLADKSDRPWKDAGYYLLYPIVLLFLLWFRRGWTLSLCFGFCVAFSIQVTPPVYAAEEEVVVESEASKKYETSPKYKAWPIVDGFLKLLLTPDQQGRFYFERGDYAISAQRFQDPAWKGMAFYHAENFTAAVEMFRQINSSTGRFNLANALAQGQHYVRAVKVYSQVLNDEPEHASALRNRQLVQIIIDNINHMSASQQTEQGEASRELDDSPQRADGAERGDIASDEQEQLNAEQILVDEQIYQMWMRQVQADPKRFLRSKFQLQKNRQKKLNDKSAESE